MPNNRTPSAPDQANEAWRAVPEWPAYEVSDLGRVKRVAGGKGSHRAHILNARRNGNVDYLAVCLSHRRQPGRFLVHRLVLTAFVGPCPDGMEAAHINGCKTDNRLANLQWVTHRENESHKLLHGTHSIGEKNGCAKLTEADVRWIRDNYGPLSYAKIARRFGVRRETIRDVVTRRNWNHVA